MERPVQATYQRFISAEPGRLADETPAVLLSLGGEEGPVTELAFGLDDVRQMIVELLAALAVLGDEIAERVFTENFCPPDEES